MLTNLKKYLKFSLPTQQYRPMWNKVLAKDNTTASTTRSYHILNALLHYFAIWFVFTVFSFKHTPTRGGRINNCQCSVSFVILTTLQLHLRHCST